jgi:hypothetical protein
LPQLNAIDMRLEGPDKGRLIAPKLALAVSETLARKEQALLSQSTRLRAIDALSRLRSSISLRKTATLGW